MTNSEQAIREFADQLHYCQEVCDEYHTMLIALISEHYYPKEFTEWLLENAEAVEYRGLKMWKVYLAGYQSRPYFTTEELYKIRRGNEG